MIRSQAAEWLLEDHPRPTVEEFWRHVDTSSTHPAWARDNSWGEARVTDCLARMSDGRRCTAHASVAPFCDRHLKGAREWFRMLDLRDSVRVTSPVLLQDIQSTITTARLIVEVQTDDLVYFWEIQGAGLVKIGHSNRVAVRTAQFLKGRGCTFPPDVDPSRGHLLGTAPGGRNLEAALHAKYRYARVAGEWFRLDERLATEIDSFINPTQRTSAA